MFRLSPLRLLLLLPLLTLPSTSAETHPFSTRYNDCCKPAFAWPDKSPVYHPVRSCLRDGLTTAPPSAQSGCDPHGTAFSCYDQQPFDDASNRSLSYFFAAYSIHRRETEQSGCACFHARFTIHETGEVRDAVYQVINTGDFPERNIDVLIPGAGLGIYQRGCPAQMGISAGEWGTFGGFGSVEECERLPEPVRRGCRWRFERWGDNPEWEGEGRRVRCPVQLTRVSGCVRKDEAAVKPWEGKMDERSGPNVSGMQRGGTGRAHPLGHHGPGVGHHGPGVGHHRHGSEEEKV